MKVKVDEILCTGHGRCHLTSPDVYKIDELGFNNMGTFEVPVGLDSDARAGAQRCPEFAITVLEDDTGGDVHSP